MQADAHAPANARANAATTGPQPPHAAAATAPAQRWVDPEGKRFSLRALQAQDVALLDGLWNEGLSRPSRFRRFHASLARISPERLAAWCQPNASQGEALVITQLLPGGEKAVAEGRWAWTREPGRAELSLSVADRWQGWGLGRRMLQALLLGAQSSGARVLQADVLVGNGAMLALLQQAGFVASTTDSCKQSDEDSDTLSFERALTARQRHSLNWLGRSKPALAKAGLLWDQWLDHLATALIALRLDLGFGLDSTPRRQRGGFEALN